MIVKLQKGGILNPAEVYRGIDSVVVLLDNGTPVTIAMDRDGVVFTTHVNEQGFDAAMRAMGYQYQAPDISKVPDARPT